MVWYSNGIWILDKKVRYLNGNHVTYTVWSLPFEYQIFISPVFGWFLYLTSFNHSNTEYVLYSDCDLLSLGHRHVHLHKSTTTTTTTTTTRVYQHCGLRFSAPTAAAATTTTNRPNSQHSIGHIRQSGFRQLARRSQLQSFFPKTGC